MNKPLLLTCIWGCSFSSVVLSAPQTHTAQSHNQQPTESWYASILAGASWIDSGKETQVNFGGLATNLYQPNSNSAIGPLVGFEAGWQWRNQKNWWQAGIQSYYSQATSKHNRVRPLYFVNPSLATLDYSYIISSTPILVVGEYGWKKEIISPYLIAGVGISVNRALDYNEVPTDPNGSAQPMRSMFKDNTKIGIATELGLGLNYMLLPHVALNLQYDFTYYGKARTGTTSTSSSGSLALGHIYANNLLLKLTVEG